MENNAFNYQYSASRAKEAQSIRQKYMPKEESPIERLRELDRRVSRPAQVFGYVFGSISAVIMGGGMSFIMTDLADKLGLGNMLVPGVIIGVVGLIMAAVNYPIYKGILAARKKKYAAEVIELSERIMTE